MPKLKLPNIEDVVAIDIHTHAEEPCGMHGDDGYDDFQAQMADYFKSPNKHPPTVPETAAYYRSKNIAAVIFPVDAERETGFRRYNNYEMLEIASETRRPDPLRLDRSAQGQARRARGEEADRGIRRPRLQIPSYHAGVLSQRPDGLSAVRGNQRWRRDRAVPHRADRRRQRHARRHGDAPEIFQPDVHGRRRGRFPDLKIILAHPSFPWQEEALSVATHKPNVYIDLSGWSPKYFPPILVRYINSILQDKMLFGSDWPVITPDRWLADFAKLDIREEIRPKVLKANARKILGI